MVNGGRCFGLNEVDVIHSLLTHVKKIVPEDQAKGVYTQIVWSLTLTLRWGSTTFNSRDGDGAAALGNSLAVSENVKYKLTMQTSNFSSQESTQEK